MTFDPKLISLVIKLKSSGQSYAKNIVESYGLVLGLIFQKRHSSKVCLIPRVLTVKYSCALVFHPVPVPRLAFPGYRRSPKSSGMEKSPTLVFRTKVWFYLFCKKKLIFLHLEFISPYPIRTRHVATIQCHTASGYVLFAFRHFDVVSFRIVFSVQALGIAF
jgi:hypothetical protein